MNVTKIKTEIQSVLGVEVKAKEPNARYLKRVQAAFDKIEETTDILNKLSSDAKDFISSVSGEQEPAADNPKVPSAQKEGKKMATKSKKNASKKTSKKSNGNGRGSIITTIKKMVFKNREASVDKLAEMLDKQGVKVARPTIQTQRSGFLHSINVLKELGVSVK